MQVVIQRTSAAPSNTGWIGPAPSGLAISAILLIGTVGMLIAGVQTVVLDALVLEGRLTSAWLGWTTTAEFLALGLGIVLSGLLSQPRHLRWVIALAALAALVADLAVLRQTGLSIVINRSVAGLAEGVLTWLPGCMIARSASPTRWSGIFLTLQAVAQLTFTAIVPATLMSSYGANGGFLGLAVTAVLAMLGSLFIPTAFVELPRPTRLHGVSVLGSPTAIASLVSVLGIAAFSIGLFAYLGPLATQAGLDTRLLGLAVSASLAAQIAGSALAAAASKWLTYYPLFAISVVINITLLTVYASMPSPPLFIAASAVFGFFWMFFLPFQLPLVIEADPTRRIAVILSGVQLFGCAAGPYLCSLFVTETDARGALVVCGLCFLGSFVISTVIHFTRRR